MIGLIKKSAETWFVGGTLSLLEQRMRGFKELSAYLPAAERDIADHHAWIRYGEPYSGARRKAGYVDAADFLLKAYASIARRLIEREGWPEPASLPAQHAIVATLAVTVQNGEDIAIYDIKTLQAEQARRDRLKQIQDEEERQRKEKEAELARKTEIDAIVKRMAEEREERQKNEGKGLSTGVWVIIVLVCLLASIAFTFAINQPAKTAATTGTPNAAPTVESGSPRATPPATVKSAVDNAESKGETEEREQRKRQEQAQLAAVQENERQARVQREREALEKAKQSTPVAPQASPKVGSIQPTSPSASKTPPPSDIIVGRTTCISDDGTKFSIVSQGGGFIVTYGQAPSIRAKVDYAGAYIVLLSKIVPNDAIAINLMRGDKDGTVIVVSDARGVPQRTIGAKCSGVAVN
jgi:hypothetical protein